MSSDLKLSLLFSLVSSPSFCSSSSSSRDIVMVDRVHLMNGANQPPTKPSVMSDMIVRCMLVKYALMLAV